jgi:hypothetical protein
MNALKTSPPTIQFVPAPPPTHPTIPPSIYGVKLNSTEKVEWEWLDLPDGNRVVTGYKILKAV